MIINPGKKNCQKGLFWMILELKTRKYPKIHKKAFFTALRLSIRGHLKYTFYHFFELFMVLDTSKRHCLIV